MKDNSKKTNKQNTTRARAQALGRRVSRRSKDDRRRILFSKKHVKMDERRVRYGTTSGASYAIARGTDLNRRFIAAFLALVFAISCLVVGVNFATRAEDSVPVFNMLETTDDSGLVLRKGLKDNGDGTYDLKMEAYATSATASPEAESSMPLDIVFVVDQSQSMGSKDMPVDNNSANNKYRYQVAQETMTSIAEAVAKHANSAELEHRIAVAGYSSDLATVYDASKGNRVSEAVSTAIAAANGSGTSTLSADIKNANTIFEAHKADQDYAQRKRIIVVLTDGESNDVEREKVLAHAADSESEFAANIYTVGLFPTGNPDTTTSTFLENLSTNSNSELNPIYPADSSFSPYKKYYYDNNGQYTSVSTQLDGQSTLAGWLKTDDGYMDYYNRDYAETRFYDSRNRLLTTWDHTPGNSEKGHDSTDYRLDVYDQFYTTQDTSTPITGTNLTIGQEYWLGKYTKRYTWNDGIFGIGRGWTQSTENYVAPTQKVVYEFRWVDSDRYWTDPMQSESDTDTSHHQFYDLTHTANSSGVDYTYNAANTTDVANAISKITKTLKKPETSVTLDAGTVLKDVITANFVVPNTENWTWETVAGTYNADAEPIWDNTTNSGRPNWDSSTNTLSVTGFNYSDKRISDDHTSGEKLVVTITGLELSEAAKKSTALLYSNETNSGIYHANYSTDNPVVKFPRPFVDQHSSMVPEGESGSMTGAGTVVNKYLTPNSNGKYDLTLEAYTTEEDATIEEKIPTDFVVVVDQSGSMGTENKDIPIGYNPVSGTKTLDEIAAGNYYVQGEDGNYYRVYPVRDYLYQYYPANYWYVGDILDRVGADLSWFQGADEVSFNYANQFYYRESNGVYRPMTLTIAGKTLTYYNQFTYINSSGQEVSLNRDNEEYGKIVYANLLGSFGWGRTIDPGEFGYNTIDGFVRGVYNNKYAYTYSEVPIFSNINTGMYVNYPMYDRRVGYNELRYRDIKGVEHVVKATNGGSSWEYCNNEGKALVAKDSSNLPQYDNLYQPSDTITRIEALKLALTDFALAVANEKDDFGKVDNKVAIVGFSSPGYSNDELLTGANVNVDATHTNGVQKNNATTNDYATALISATNTGVGTVNTKITNAISAITANGGTQPENGLEMAYNILDKRTNKKYRVRSPGEKQGEEIDRNTIVIFFTDGRPGDYKEDNQYEEANEVVTAALPIKQSGAKLFSIGIFGESDNNPLTYDGRYDSTVNPETGRTVQVWQLNTKFWPYLGGWMETYRSGGINYCLRRQWRPHTDGYPEVANDTIFDYMSVISSNYPDAEKFIAPAWLNGTFEEGDGTYTEATDGIRHKTADSNKNEHYRMASSQDTLVAAFTQAVTMMSSKFSEDAILDEKAILRDILRENTFTSSDTTKITASTVVGTMDKNGIVTFDPATEQDVTNIVNIVPTKEGDITTAVDVSNFSYLENYIKYGKEAKGGLKANQGKKLVVKFTDVYPTGDVVSTEPLDAGYTNAVLVKSNNDGSGLYAVNNNKESLNAEFPKPAITRHRYKLDVLEANTAAKFDVSARIVTVDPDSDVTVVSPQADALKDVMIVFPGTNTRLNYRDFIPQTVFENMGKDDSFYFENVPKGYKIQVDITAIDDAYTYHIYYDDDAATSSTPMQKGTPITPAPFTYQDHVIHIRSERSTKNVLIREETVGDYSDSSQIFEERITMDIPASNTSGPTEDELKRPCSFNENYSGYGENLPQGAEEYKAVFTWNEEPAVDGKYTATLTSIQSKKNDVTYNYPVTNGLPMKDGDEITITVPTGNTVKVIEPDTHDHEVSYYSNQDNVDASAIKLVDMNGELLTGEYNLTLVPLEGVQDASEMSVKFVDGHITKVDGSNVDGTTKLDFTPYQFMSSSDTFSSVFLDIDGTRTAFSRQGEDSDANYIASVKRRIAEPPASVTVDKNDMNILVVNQKEEIPVTGIGDSSTHNWIIYILAAFGGLAAIGAGIFLWKKRNEFVEE